MGADASAGVDETEDEIALDFASFLRVMGLEGSNEDYFDMEAEDLRRRCDNLVHSAPCLMQSMRISLQVKDRDNVPAIHPSWMAVDMP